MNRGAPAAKLLLRPFHGVPSRCEISAGWVPRSGVSPRAQPNVATRGGALGGFDPARGDEHAVPVERRDGGEIALVRRPYGLGELPREQVVHRDVVLVAGEVPGRPEPADEQDERDADCDEGPGHARI